MKEVAELARVISKRIHDTPWKRNTLLQDTPAWEMLWSCFDAVEDRALALEAYLEMPEPPDQGTRYLVVCGALQALFVQQDATVNLADALDVTYEPNLLLKEVREIRNNSIGHPTKRGGGEGKAFNFLPRHIDTKQDFDLMTTYPDGTPPTFQYVNIPKLIGDQRSVVKEFLQNVDAHLEREDMEHKEQFRERRLQDAFPQTLRYNISKIYEAIRGNPGRETYLKLDFGAVEETLAAFRERLAERGEAGAYLWSRRHLRLPRLPASAAPSVPGAKARREDEREGRPHLLLLYARSL